MKTPTIHTKLLAFQRLGISVKKDGSNPHFKSKYATLNEVLDKVKKPLNDMGVLIIFTPQTEGLGTSLYDTDSGTEVTAFMKYTNCDTPQKTLSCNTYFRRGSLVSLLGLEDEDDDGNTASAPTPPKRENKQPETTITRTWGGVKPFIEEPIEKIKACKTKAELTALYNSMPAQQQAIEHVIEVFKIKAATFKTK